MFLVGICDDEELHRQHIKELCEQYFAKYPQEYTIVEFASGEELLSYQKIVDATETKMHLLFLDVLMDGMDGIEVLRRVERNDWIWRVVFVSSCEDAVWDSFSLKTLGFSKKPAEYVQIEKWLKTAIRENSENCVLEYLVDGRQEYIYLEEIYYLEASGNFTYLHTKNESIFLGESLKQWQEKVKDMPIVRIHKSYLLNMLHVKTWDANKVKLTSGAELVIGRKYIKEARESYLAFVKRKALGRM